jgi:branched-chain amino acid transport system substrate-binding protein
MSELSRAVLLALAGSAMAGFLAIGGAAAQQKEVMVGGMCDRTGPTQINGVAICPAIQDYYELVNSKGGVEGYRIKYTEIDHETRCRRVSRPIKPRRERARSRSWSTALRRYRL